MSLMIFAICELATEFVSCTRRDGFRTGVCNFASNPQPCQELISVANSIVPVPDPVAGGEQGTGVLRAGCNHCS